MSDMKEALVDSVARAFERADDQSFAAMSTAFAALGMDGLLAPQTAGGAGGDWSDLAAIARFAGFAAVPYPLAEQIVANSYSVGEGGSATVAERAEGVIDQARGRFTGKVFGAAWGEFVERVIVPWAGAALELRVGDAASFVSRLNPAGESRTELSFQAAPFQTSEKGADLFEALALVRAAQISGALDRTLALCVDYANTRVQFGKPIGKFQTVQQNLALFAQEAAAARNAFEAAARAADNCGFGFETACAKLRANRASQVGASIAHQIFGAIGFTLEHPLNHWTRRLIAWRSEFGSDALWSERVAKTALNWGHRDLWTQITARSDQVWVLSGER